MKTTAVLTIAVIALLAVCALLGVLLWNARADEPVSDISGGNYTNEMKIPYAVDMSPPDGADSVERQGDHKDSPYFSSVDFYNAEPTDTLTILKNYKTYQQTTEWSCGVAAALTVLQYYGRLGDWNEESLAALRSDHSSAHPGSCLIQLKEIFDGVGGFTYESVEDYDLEEITLSMLRGYLKNGIPVLIAWNDWGGHWETLIGYDDMGTETESDDVMIVADPYDTTDHNQDGYGVYGAERFYYNFTMYGFFGENEPNDMVFLAPKLAG